jgi:hypothetical protein
LVHQTAQISVQLPTTRPLFLACPNTIMTQPSQKAQLLAVCRMNASQPIIGLIACQKLRDGLPTIFGGLHD